MKARFSYDGNEQETYSLFDNEKLIAYLLMGEDEVRAFVNNLNKYMDIWHSAYSKKEVTEE